MPSPISLSYRLLQSWVTRTTTTGNLIISINDEVGILGVIKSRCLEASSCRSQLNTLIDESPKKGIKFTVITLILEKSALKNRLSWKGIWGIETIEEHVAGCSTISAASSERRCGYSVRTLIVSVTLYLATGPGGGYPAAMLRIVGVRNYSIGKLRLLKQHDFPLSYL